MTQQEIANLGVALVEFWSVALTEIARFTLTESPYIIAWSNSW